MFLGLLKNKQIPWIHLNSEIDKIKYKGDPNYSDMESLELTQFKYSL